MDSREQELANRPDVLKKLTQKITTGAELYAWYDECNALIERVPYEQRKVLSRILMQAFTEKLARIELQS